MSISESKRCPSADQLQQYLDEQLGEGDSSHVERHVDTCAECEKTLQRLTDDSSEYDETEQVGSARGAAETLPFHVGRYQCLRHLGQGGFGNVYLAQDEQLQRNVALKLAKARPLLGACRVGSMAFEATALARLEHPNIVSVYDSGQLDDGREYVVCQYVDGESLAEVQANEPIDWALAVSIIATLSEALHFAHRRRMVHRDIKPSNILLSEDGTPYLADFGLAMRDEDYGDPSHQGGTVGYLSPEQARGEGHLVDGRSDLFSLGVVLYELLVGELPFRGTSATEVLQRITSVDPRPPRQLNDQLPQRVERICLKCLEKSPLDRYTTAADLADELRAVLEASAEQTLNEANGNATEKTMVNGDDPPPHTHSKDECVIVPRGLRSFEYRDHRFFLNLLPGPRDGAGVPNCISDWVEPITNRDPRRTFRVGVIYGPSGSGKSSLVKAGVVPRVESLVRVVLLEASDLGLSRELLNVMRSKGIDVDGRTTTTSTTTNTPASGGSEAQDRSIVEPILSRLRNASKMGQKTVIIIDQFERWLVNPKDSSSMIELFRHCDGANLQCLVVLRDEFWMQISRLCAATDIGLGHNNCRPVDLFYAEHAQHVLFTLGQGYGAIAESSKLNPSQAENSRRFVKACVAELVDERQRVAPIQLVLLAEMLKNQPWQLATLRRLGGHRGLGAEYLHELFEGSLALPTARKYQGSAKRVLRALLPATASDLGHITRSDEELRSRARVDSLASWRELLDLLDRELRLVSPVNLTLRHGAPDETAADGDATEDLEGDELRYHLTHDFLVPAIRDWLRADDERHFSGRARRLLEERTGEWSLTEQRRFLPSLAETGTILLGTRKLERSGEQNRMLTSAKRWHGQRLALIALLAAVMTFGVSLAGRAQARSKRQQFAQRISEVSPEQLQTLLRSGPILNVTLLPYLDEALAKVPRDSDSEFHLELVKSLIEESMSQRMLVLIRGASVDRAFVMRQVLGATLSDGMRKEVAEEMSSAAYSQQSVLGLAALWCHDEKAVGERLEDSIIQTLAQQISELPLSESAVWQRYLRNVADQMLDPMRAIYLTETRSDKREATRDFLFNYDQRLPTRVQLCVREADSASMDEYWSRLVGDRSTAIRMLREELDGWREHAANALLRYQQTGDISDRTQHETAIARAVCAACALLRFEDANSVWPMLRRDSDPSFAALWASQAGPMGVEPRMLADLLLRVDTHEEIRQHMVLALGSYKETQLPPIIRRSLIEELSRQFSNSDNAGLHAAIEWLASFWPTLSNELAKVSQAPVAARVSADTEGQWFFDTVAKSTFVRLGPATFKMGSDAHDPNAFVETEVLHERTIDYAFAIDTYETTVGHFSEFLATRESQRVVSSDELELPVTNVTWNLAAEYCNWLTDRAGLGAHHRCYRVAFTSDETIEIRVVEDSLTRLGYRLPTEAEWEYACRAGSVTLFNYGVTSQLSTEYGWVDSNSGSIVHQVGRLKPNRFGLFDVYGNALEWCHNPIGRYVARDDLFAQAGDAKLRAQRGGHARNPASLARSAIRYSDPPTAVNPIYGLRLARTLPEAE